MKHICLFLFIITALTPLSGQFSYEEAMNLAEKAVADEDYATALKMYRSAQYFDPKRQGEVDKRIDQTFIAITRQRKRALSNEKIAQEALAAARIADEKTKQSLQLSQEAEKRAKQSAELALAAEIKAKKAQEQTEEALKLAHRIINAFYFYNERMALAYKNGKYGYIDKQGNVIIDYDYDEALPFNDFTGLAMVRRNNKYYLLDTSLHKYLIVKKASNIKPESEAIDISAQRHKRLPAEILECRDLKFLWLNNNELETLPVEFGRFFGLRQLDVSNNRLSKLPESFSTLKQLERLDLNTNSLTAFDKLENLYQLTDLNLRDNQFTVLPHGLFRLDSLRKLDCSINPLIELPANIGKLLSLTVLVATDNSWTKLPDELCALKNLKRLNLKGNKLTVLPDNLGHLTQLEELNLGFNKLESLPKSIEQLQGLHYLDLSYNKFSEIPPEIRQLRDLNEINLTNNRLTTLPEWLTEFPNLQIHISNNPNLIIPESCRHLIAQD